MPDNRNKFLLNIYDGTSDAVLYDLFFGLTSPPVYVNCSTGYTGGDFVEMGADGKLYLVGGGTDQQNLITKQFDPAGAGCAGFWKDQSAATPLISGQVWATTIGVPIDYLAAAIPGCTGI